MIGLNIFKKLLMFIIIYQIVIYKNKYMLITIHIIKLLMKKKKNLKLVIMLDIKIKNKYFKKKVKYIAMIRIK